MRRKLWVVGAVVGLGVAAVVGAGAVLAQSGENASGTFLDRVAAKLGIDSAQLEQAITDTRNEDVDARVAEGDLTVEEAERLKEKLGELHGDGFGLRIHPGRPGGGPFDGPFLDGDGPRLGRGFGFEFGFGLPEALDSLAEFLETDADTLREELAAEDATLASVAESHGKSSDELKAFISQDITERIDAAVAEGKVPQEMADDLKEKLNAVLDEIVEGKGLGRHGSFEFKFRHHGPGGDGAEKADPSTEPSEPQSGSGGGVSRS
jgi:uncharacterized protein YidB (DUF937 family)